MPDESLKDRLVVWKPVLLVKVLKISWTVLNHCFVVWMDAFSAQRRYPAVHDSFKPLFCCVDDAFSAQRRYPAVHGQVGGIVLLSRETCTVGKPIPLCPGDLKHCMLS
ncbi:hypothetical protein TNCT_648831 [Trichonephila clavata]|uniref:Uncharacterized protein n=1 Tax=Trichonephila clavata TaxID=2740835 RepID=A0A8X6FBK9_TRICU|nr:hypothetical protein TNCT_648831 [Trichonephila clavata]